MSWNEKKKHIISILVVSTFLILSTTFVYFPKQENFVSSLAFLHQVNSFYMEDLSSGILLKNTSCVKDEKGLQQDPYQFKVVNQTNQEITYRIVFHKDFEKINQQGKEALENHYLRYTLKEGEQAYLEPQNLNDDGILYETTIPKRSEVVYDFKMWLDYDADNGAMNKLLIGNIEIERIG